ncbi:MAG: leucine-rich repeat domain-containing protein [Oscillospiraceae bacterium]|nr:leucine-rich repeat domain-containing protein [Oscillospiraceae bacterium]
MTETARTVTYMEVEFKPGVHIWLENQGTSWRVLDIDRETETALLIAEKPICERAYDGKYKNTTWKASSLRAWLNGEFYEKHFSEEEKAAIVESELRNSDNPDNGTADGDNTRDKVFLLSIDEAMKYFQNDRDRATRSQWWLRSRSSHDLDTVIVGSDGRILYSGYHVSSSNGVRPALKIDLKSDLFRSMVSSSSSETIFIKAPELFIEDGKVVGVSPDAKEITIPEGVTRLAEKCFFGCSNLTDVIISTGVKSIGRYAFDNCSNLASVTIPEGVEIIGQSAFSNCTSLVSVTIPEGMIVIEDRAFYECRELTEVKIPDSVMRIGNNAFCGCLKLRAVTISKRVTTISYYMFKECRSLMRVTLQEGVKKIAEGAFDSCSGLVQIDLPDGLEEIEKEAFHYCTSLESVTVPASVKAVGISAFAGCTSLRKTVVMEGVEELRYRAFSFCENLAEAVLPKSICRMGASVFMDCPNVQFSVPEGSYADNYLKAENDDPAERCERPFQKWREFFRFSMRQKGAHISGCLTEEPVVYIPDAFGNAPIQGFEKDAIPEKTIVLCSGKVFAKLPYANRLTTLKASLENAELFTEEELKYFTKYIKSHQAAIIEAFLEKDDVETVKKIMRVKKLSPSAMDELLSKHTDAETRMLLLTIQNEMS